MIKDEDVLKVSPRKKYATLSLLIRIIATVQILFVIYLHTSPSVRQCDIYDDDADAGYSDQEDFSKISIRSNKSIYLPGPCKHTNDEYLLLLPYFQRWSDINVAQKRRDWQYWLTEVYPKNFYTFREANQLTSLRGFAPMEGRGIVIPFGRPEYIKFVKTSIELLRKYGCKLPIEIWFFEPELQQDSRDQVFAMSRPDAPVYLRFAEDPLNYLPMEKGTGQGYHIKIPAIINSSFRHVLFLDFDCLVMNNPEYLFETPEYNEHGTIFWTDYWKTHRYNPAWRYFGEPCVDEWEQESGMMVIDKERAWKALHLMWYVNRNEDIRVWHSFLLGDKDLFRFTWRATNTPVYYVQHWLAPAGFMTPTGSDGSETFCGLGMIQHDPTGKMLFAHVNLFKDRPKRFFSMKNHPIGFVKRYKPIHHYTYDPPAGPIPGTSLAWATTRGARARFLAVPNFLCIDLDDNQKEDIKREWEIVPLDVEDGGVHPDFMDDFYNLLVKDWAKAEREAHESKS